MTNLADAYDAIAEGFAAAALALREGATTPQDAPSATQAPSFEDLPFDDFDAPEAEAVAATPHGSAAVCPAHNIVYRDGKFGPYCPSLGTDPKWTNARGYCQVTPKNAAAWLRQKAAA